ncbi:MAG: DNA primase [Thiolinea sp.]
MAGLIPKDFIDQLLTRVDIVDVINARVPLKKAGREYVACCPFHGEKTPSFTVSPGKQFYHCFGCGVHGSAISFLMEYEHLEYAEAIEALAASQGLDVPRETTNRQGSAKKTKKNKDLYALLEEAAVFYAQNLPLTPLARDYVQQRGLSAEVVRQYGVGYAPDAWDALSQRFGRDYGSEPLLASGLQLKNEAGRVYDRFRGRLMFPIRDRRGRVIGFGGRIVGEGTPKYLNSPETEVFHKGSELYGLYEARQQTRKLERLLVVEGYMDVIALAQFGVTYAVATLGTATTSQHIQQLFKLVPEVVFCFDGDRAGKEAAWRALENALPEMRDGRDIRFLFLPEGEDPDTQIRRVGQEAFEADLKKALPLSKFFTIGLKEELGFSGEATLHVSEDGARFMHEARRLLELMPDILLKRPLLAEVQRLGGAVVPERQAEPENAAGPKPFIRGRWKKQGRWWSEPEPESGVLARDAKDFEIRKTPVRYAITLLLHSPELALLAGNPEKMLEWDLPGIGLLVRLVEIIEEHPHIHSAGLLEQFRDTQHEKVLLKLMSWQPRETEEQVLQREFQDCFRQIKRQARQKALELLLHKEQTQGLSPQEKHDLLSLLDDIHGTSG